MKLIDYDKLVHEALRGVINDLLLRIQAKGLPGEHHFYITFQTSACQVAPWLKKRYPEEMTVVLQKQFESLQVDEDKFSITLYFDNRPEKLVVPFKAITGFADPYASFSLRMASGIVASEANETGQADGASDATDGKENAKGEVVSLAAFRDKK